MSSPTPPRRREFQLWAMQAERQLAECHNLEEWGLWVAQNGTRLGECEQFNPPAYATVKAAIDAKQREFPAADVA